MKRNKTLDKTKISLYIYYVKQQNKEVTNEERTNY